MFLRADGGVELAGGSGTGAMRAPGVPRPAPITARRRMPAAAIDWTPDLGDRIGSRDWWRGLATCAGLCWATWMLAPPGVLPLVGAVPAPPTGAALEEARAGAIAPLALGAGTGRRMAATELVMPLAQAPERPVVELSATLGQGDAFDRALVRAGVARAQAAEAARLVAETTPLADIPAGTRIALTLGRRAVRTQPRPLEKLALRARFDLGVALVRAGDRLVLRRQPIAVDATPLRLRGLVGSSLYRSARAAGAPARAVEAYIRAMATRLSIGRDVTAADRFDMVIERQRAATGETRLGELLYAGLDRGGLDRPGLDGRGRAVRLMRWHADGAGAAEWFDAAGQDAGRGAERHGAAGMPVAGRVTSNFGMRMHPLLGFLRMHKGLDIAAPYGTPIVATLSGVVASAGRSAGYGNFVRLAHAGGLASGYGHMSRIAVRPGMRVQRGEVIGYVGSTGLSTGPHLHWEMWRNGQSVNPRSLSFASVARLSGENLRAFKRAVAAALAVKAR